MSNLREKRLEKLERASPPRPQVHVFMNDGETVAQIERRYPGVELRLYCWQQREDEQ